MIIGIVGDAERAVAWERHLRPHNIVRQVVLAPHVHDLDRVDACFIVDTTPNRTEHLLDALKEGIPCFFISDFIVPSAELERIHRTSKEAGVEVQLAHWPTLSPSTQWMKDKISKPQFIQIQRILNRSKVANSKQSFVNAWTDELALCLKWIDSGIHRIEVKQSEFSPTQPQAIHLVIRYDSGASASIQIQLSSTFEQHSRYIAANQSFIECSVTEQELKYGFIDTQGRLSFESKKFDPTKAAEKSALHFLKNIQLKKEVVYSAYDALRFANNLEKIESKLL
jgi:predicted dehydrogenase